MLLAKAVSEAEPSLLTSKTSELDRLGQIQAQVTVSLSMLKR